MEFFEQVLKAIVVDGVVAWLMDLPRWVIALLVVGGVWLMVSKTKTSSDTQPSPKSVGRKRIAKTSS